MYKRSFLLLFALSFFFLPSVVSAAYTLKKGKLIESKELATMSASEHQSALLEAYEKKKWEQVVHHATVMVKNFPDSPFYHEALFYLGAGYFHQKEYEKSIKNLSAYLRKQLALQHFREAIEFKFLIAEQFKEGARKHLLGWNAMPKWLPAREEGIKLYEEVILALPNDDLAARSLFGKAQLQMQEEDFTGSIETAQTLIRRFPKHALAPDAYVHIGQVYLIESKDKYPDVDFLDLAEINLRKFKFDFPSDERVQEAEKMLSDMQEVYATNFFEIAQFFERTKKPHASLIYYTKIVKTYPQTKSAERSKERIRLLKPQEETAQVENKPRVP